MDLSLGSTLDHLQRFIKEKSLSRIPQRSDSIALYGRYQVPVRFIKASKVMIMVNQGRKPIVQIRDHRIPMYLKYWIWHSFFSNGVSVCGNELALSMKHKFLTNMWVVVQLLVVSDPCDLPGSSVHGILQARILEWVATSFSTSRFLNKLFL